MRLIRVLFMVALVGIFAVVARADATAPIDPIAHFESPDPACGPPYCTDLTYTGPDEPGPGFLDLFFTSVPATGVAANPPAFSCDFVEGGTPYTCSTEENLAGTLFFGFILLVPEPVDTGQTFSLTVTGNPITLSLPGNVCAQDSEGNCTGATTVTVDPTPEPGTALLFMSGLGLLFLAGVAKRRFGANSVA